MSGKLQTEFEFTLPQGYVDDDGNLHKEGRMRLATAADEIEPLQDRRVQQNSSYLTILLLSRVITQLGDYDDIDVNPRIIENLFVSDLEHLQRLYERVNNRGANVVSTTCPDCGHEFEVDAESGTVSQGSPAEAAPEMGGGGGGASVQVGDTDLSEAIGGGGGMDIPDHEPDVPDRSPDREGDSGN